MTVTRNNTSRSQSKDDAKQAELAVRLQKWIQANKPLLEVLLDAYCIVDLTNHVIDFNVAFTELCGESYRKILKIGNFCDLLKTEYCPSQCPALQIITSQKSLRIDELKGVSKAHSDLQLILGGIPIVDANNEILGALITIRNVSAENELQKKYGERTKESVTDGLTKLFNKVYMESALVRLLKVALRDGQPLSVAMVDIDHFKKVNDTFGHQAGDYVLATTATLLKGESRESDIVGRFGGEEFISLLPNCDVKGSKIFGERFRNRVQKNQVAFDGKPIPVTVSIGTATFTDTWKPGLNPEKIAKELINKADTALYYAKANGRNLTWQFELLPASKSEKE